MRSLFEVDKMTRRKFGTLVAVAAASAPALNEFFGGAEAAAADTQTVPVYAFLAVENGQVTACKACHRHADNKRFASLRAADENRAHAGCNCLILMSSVSSADYARMFGGAPDSVVRSVFDLRWDSNPQSPPKTTVGGLEMPVARVR